MSVHQDLPPELERYELKYIIPWSYVEPVSRFVEAYCELDYHSTKASDHFYEVNTLYFDTPGCQFLQQRLSGKINRFNMRVRSYGDGSKPPYYLEIKHKRNTRIKKFRATARPEEWPLILADPSFRVDSKQSSSERANKERFLYLATTYAIEPKVLTCYRRRAYFSTIDDYARVTMDINLRCRDESTLSLTPDDRMISYDYENTFGANHLSDNASVVLELKCVQGQVPTWMVDLIRHFQLKQQGFSKYMNSMLSTQGDSGHHYMSNDRQSTQFAYAS
jgi:SPX domain protein involved in polyphosphate accumulation